MSAASFLRSSWLAFGSRMGSTSNTRAARNRASSLHLAGAYLPCMGITLATRLPPKKSEEQRRECRERKNGAGVNACEHERGLGDVREEDRTEKPTRGDKGSVQQNPVLGSPFAYSLRSFSPRSRAERRVDQDVKSGAERA